MSSKALRIVHVFRAPLGGLFRHVVDLSTEQARRGHEIGLFFDANGGDCERVRAALASIPGGLKLGVEMAPIARNPGLSDFTAFAAFSRYLAQARPDVVHGHGSKGGLFARLSGPRAGGPIRAYTPHGGSFNYKPGGLMHALYMRVERMLATRTDAFLFESDHIRQKYDEKVGVRAGIARIVVNGLSDREFTPAAPGADATDLLYVGELRAAKGVDTLLESLALANRETPSPLSATLVGSGPDREALIEQARRLGLGAHVRFPGPMPVAQAFALGRMMVAPSRAESMPYIVLETAAAQLPMITTHVGGVPEIYGPYADRLAPPDDPADLARRILAEVRRPPEERARRAAELAAYVQGRFSLENMVETVISAYREAIARRSRGLPSRGGANSPAGAVNEA